MGASVGNGAVALARVEGTIRGDRADLHISGDLAEQFRQHWGITDVATGDLDGANLQRLFIDADVDLAPQTAFRAAVLARMPLALSLRLDAIRHRPRTDGGRCLLSIRRFGGPCEPR